MKKTVILPLIGALMLSLTACGAKEPVAEEIVEETLQTTEAAEEETTATEEAVGLANPWREITEEEAMQYAPNMFSVPEGGENAIWSVMEAEETPLVQVVFDLDGNTFTAREQVTGDEYKDISGVYYEWDAEDTGTLAGWGTGLMEGKFYRHIGDEGYTDLATWFDVEIGISYSLSVTAADLDGFDIQAVVEAMYDPAKQASNLIPDDYVPMDITGCDTFTQILDKLDEKAGFANTTINGVDVLLVSTEGTYDNDGVKASISAEVYYYKDGVPTYAGYVMSSGTAYPLAVKDGLLYTAGNHEVVSHTLQNGTIVAAEEAYETFDKDGNATYAYFSLANDVETAEDGTVADDSLLSAMFDKYSAADVIAFSGAK